MSPEVPTLFDQPFPIRGSMVPEYNQPPPTALFSVPYQRHSETSQAAAEAIKPEQANLRERVYEAIAASPCGLTDEQIAERTGLNPSTARPRRIELWKAGRVNGLGQERTRSGRWATLWRAQT
jgi:hypothetical protein